MADPAKIVLCLMVRNESAVIERCLGAALPICDAAVVVDTGSTDDTVARAIRYLGAQPLPFDVVPEPWQDFGRSRTRSFEVARAFAADIGWNLAASYALFLDADMILHTEPSFDKSQLWRAHYYLEQRNHGLVYVNTRLGRLDHAWRAVGVTHEYWAAEPATEPPQVCPGLWIEDLDDGGCRADKYSRDIALLEQGLRDEPDNARYMFYLGRTLIDAGRRAEGLALLRRRADAGGFWEEAWYARYRLGLELLKEGDREGITTLLAAFAENPRRAEPLIRLAEHYRARSQPGPAFLFAWTASQMEAPSSGLFVESAAFDYAPKCELMISGYYLPYGRAHGNRAGQALALDRRLDDGARQHALQQLTFYAADDPLEARAVREGRFEIPGEITWDPAPHWGLTGENVVVYSPKNPTVVKTGWSYLVHVPLVNYHHARGVIFAPLDADGVSRTRGALISRWTPDGGGDASELQVTLPEGWRDDPSLRIRGLEDLRFCSHAGRVWFTATTYHSPLGVAGGPQVVLGRLDTAARQIEKLWPLSWHEARDCEKNWVPFSYKGSLCLLYGYEPFTVLEVEAGDTIASCRRFRPSQLLPVAAGEWRGGAAMVLGEYLYVLVHVTARFWSPPEVEQNRHRTVYMHRIAVFSLEDAFAFLGVSDLFTFGKTAGVEYATGMVPTDDGNVLITYGKEEREARWIEVTEADLSARARQHR